MKRPIVIIACDIKGQWTAPRQYQSLFLSSLKMAVRIRRSDWEKDEQLNSDLERCVSKLFETRYTKFCFSWLPWICMETTHTQWEIEFFRHQIHSLWNKCRRCQESYTGGNGRPRAVLWISRQAQRKVREQHKLDIPPHNLVYDVMSIEEFTLIVASPKNQYTKSGVQRRPWSVFRKP